MYPNGCTTITEMVAMAAVDDESTHRCLLSVSISSPTVYFDMAANYKVRLTSWRVAVVDVVRVVL